eukprot:c9254_g1_i2.p1 GENE.c9254_g1_i2~~c9254_g1_i2.p1  ORF type:complete len:127 (-),score=14.63 c9254_g1_i2:145-525(-)
MLDEAQELRQRATELRVSPKPNSSLFRFTSPLLSTPRSDTTQQLFGHHNSKPRYWNPVVLEAFASGSPIQINYHQLKKKLEASSVQHIKPRVEFWIFWRIFFFLPLQNSMVISAMVQPVPKNGAPG